ncbi:PREDICTED: uncharacterized protein LOC108540664 isoform X1 [Rhinopithecus bieti]|uniref:uncharacterized protein LOC108540664 isoform X1 n=1 Tax=Rhinopithecus bieti TaxID=61621 RepID=UPI00083BC989|nr:PREDICTED: uncharacterized protein LOC108540664 isoform X1 [Rhinopithecus bieti]
MVPAATAGQVPSGPRPPVRGTGQPAGPASRTGLRRKEIPWNETNGSPGFGRVSSEQMGQQQPERLLPLAENTILDLTILFVTPRDGPGTEKWMAAVTTGEDCLRLPGRGPGARLAAGPTADPAARE